VHGGKARPQRYVIITGANDVPPSRLRPRPVTVLSRHFWPVRPDLTVEGTANGHARTVYIRGDGRARRRMIEQDLGRWPVYAADHHLKTAMTLGGSAIATNVSLQAGTYTLSFVGAIAPAATTPARTNDLRSSRSTARPTRSPMSQPSAAGATRFLSALQPHARSERPGPIGFGAINTGETFYTRALSEQVTLIRGTASDVGSIDADDATVNGAAIVLDSTGASPHAGGGGASRECASYGTYTVTADGEWTYTLRWRNATVPASGWARPHTTHSRCSAQDGSASKTVRSRSMAPTTPRDHGATADMT